jgi:DNA-binding NarL/FixJ family response regulator
VYFRSTLADSMPSDITIAVADSEVLVRLGLRHLLQEQAGFQVVAEAGNEAELMGQLKDHKAQVVIIDYNQPRRFAPQTVRRLKEDFPDTNILVISSDEDKHSVYSILEMGVNSFLTKTCDQSEIIDAIKATAKGDKFYCTRVVNYLLEKSFSKTEPPVSPLSEREIEVVQLIAKGFVAKEIAKLLHLSTHTVYTHRKNIMKKLDLKSSSELVLYAVHQAWV